MLLCKPIALPRPSKEIIGYSLKIIIVMLLVVIVCDCL